MHQLRWNVAESLSKSQFLGVGFTQSVALRKSNLECFKKNRFTPTRYTVLVNHFYSVGWYIKRGRLLHSKQQKV